MESMTFVFAVWMALATFVLMEENRVVMDFPLRDAVTENKHWSMPEEHPLRRHLATSPGKYLGRLREDEVETLRQKLKEEDWNQFTPPPITEVQCHVEFQVTKRVPGRCTKLGGHIPACQTEEYVEIDYNECS